MKCSELVSLLVVAAAPLSAQSAVKRAAVDEPMAAPARRAVTGTYALLQPGRADTTWLRVFEQDGHLYGQMRENAPTALLHQGAQRFIPAESPEVIVRFTPVTGKAAMVIIEGPGLSMTGARGERQAVADPSVAGPLFDEMARADSLLFDAAYVTCDIAAVGAMLTNDVEFYHDKSGFHAGAGVRQDFARLTSDCPRKNGIVRVVRPATLRVYPIRDFGVVQMGEHEFRKAGEKPTGARFVHLWTNRSGHWQLSRVMSFDHLSVQPQ